MIGNRSIPGGVLLLAGGLLVPIVAAIIAYVPPSEAAVSLCLLLGSGLWMHRLAGLFRVRLVTIPGIWWFLYVLMVFIPAHDIAQNGGTRSGATYLWVVRSVLLTIPAGIWLASRVTRFSLAEIGRYFQAPVVPTPRPRLLVLGVAGTMIVIMGLTVGYFVEASEIPLFYLFQNPGQSQVAAQLREDSWKLLDSPFVYWYTVVRQVAYPFLISLILGFFLRTRRRFWLLVFVVTLVIGLLFAAASTAKMPVVSIAVVGSLFVYLYRGGRIGALGTAMTVGLVAAFPVGIMFLSTWDSELGLWSILKMLYRRVFYNPAEVALAYFEVIPDELGFLGGRTIGKYGWLMGQESFDIEGYVYHYMFPTGFVSGAAPGPFFCNFYADFGFPGVLGGGVFAGFLMQAIQIWILRREKNIVNVGGYAFLAWAFTLINAQSLPVTLLSGGVGFVIAGMALLASRPGRPSVRPEPESAASADAKRGPDGAATQICMLTSVHSPFDTRIFQKEARTLRQAGYRVTLVAPCRMDETVDGVRIRCVPKPRSRWRRMTVTVWRVLREGLRTRARVFHFHDPELLGMGWILKALGKRVVYDVHEDVPRDILAKEYLPAWLRRVISRLYNSLEKHISRQFDAVIVAREDIVPSFQRFRVPCVISNYPILSLFRTSARNPPVGPVRAIYVGGISEDRGITELVQAVSLLGADVPLHLDLYGTFSSTAYEGTVKSMSGFRRAAHGGWIDYARIPERLADADVGVVCFLPDPNNINSGPTKLFEYMAAGLPVIASRFPSWREIVEGNRCGLCVDPADSEDTARALRWIVDHPDQRREMGRRAREAVERRYNWESEGRRLTELYRTLLDR